MWGSILIIPCIIYLSLQSVWGGPVPSFEGPGGTPKRVLVMTRYRSGSSFVGNLFAHHPDVFYAPEPLQLVLHPRWYDNEALDLEDVSDPVDPIYECNFDDIYEESLWKQDQVGTWNRVFCSRASSINMKSGSNEFCQNSMKMPSAMPLYTSRVCNLYKHIVIKTIRMRNMDILQHMIEDVKTKVVHSVRDPRGQLSSILSLRKLVNLPIEKLQEWATAICEDVETALDKASKAIEEQPSLAENYLLVRYEDVALNPTAMTQGMYDFAGLDFHPEVKNWITFSTNTATNITYGVIRKSSDVAFAWTEKLTYEQVQTIQDTCAGALDRLGYIMIDSEEDLKSHRNLLKEPEDRFVSEHMLIPE